MKDRSTYGPLEYILVGIFWGIILSMLYSNFLFRCLGYYTYGRSKLILWGMIGLSLVICRSFIFKNHRTFTTLSIALIIPFGIYTILTYRHTLKSLIINTLIVSTVIAICIIVLILVRKVKNPMKKKQIVFRRLHRCVETTLSIYAIGMLVIMLPMLIQGIFGVSTIRSSVPATYVKNNEEQTIDNNIETILKLQEKEWVKLTTKEKLNVMQTVANIEGRYLGLSSELNVGAANLSAGTVSGYLDLFHALFIDLEHLEKDDVKEVLTSCCHEVYHAYQYRLIDAYNSVDDSLKNLKIYERAKSYIDEFNNYTSGSDDYDSYHNQTCESDARRYADIAVEDYMNRIDQYLKKEKKKGD